MKPSFFPGPGPASGDECKYTFGMDGDQFQCECCGETFTKSRTDAAAQAESRRLFGELPPEDQAVVCDGCFKEFQAWMASHQNN